MADVFLSYNREDQAVARRYAEAFEREGLTVWWDATLNPGEAYDEVTEKALLDAKAVVVLWSKKSVVSRWVRAEATQADRNKTLVPVMIEPCTRPIMFELTQTSDLSQWKGNADDPAWQAFLAGVRRFVDKGDPTAAASRIAPAPRIEKGGRRPVVAAIALAALLLIAGGIYLGMNRGGGAPSAAAAAGTSLAVLPFADMSAEKDQEYFSDGLAEELLNELAQIKELRVAGRTSSFSFKGKNEDLRVIGQKLGVANILEGSVRKAGNRLRITAQLINAADGSHLWSNTYDRELNDVFAVQEEIAMAVTGALSVTLDIGAMSRANGGTTNVAAYDKYLQGQALWYRGGALDIFQRASQLYRDAIALDAGFARAWYGLHKTLEQETVYPGAAPRAAEMRAARERLVALAPRAWFTQSILTTDLVYQRKWAEAEASAKATLESSPGPETALTYGIFLQRVGRAREAVEYIRRAAEAEPLSAAMSTSLQIVLDMAGRPEEAQAEYVRSKTLGGGRLLADMLALQRTLFHTPPDKPAVAALMRTLMSSLNAPSLLGLTPDNWNDRPRALAAVRREFERQPVPDISFSSIGDYYGDKEMVFVTIRKQLVERNAPQIFALWQFNDSGWRNDPRYKDILRDLKLVDYYRNSGKWPDNCKPVGTDDFECT